MSDRPPPRVTQENSGSGKTGIALIVGGLVVAVAVLAYVIFGGADGGDDVDVNVEGGAEAVEEGSAEAVEDAGDAVEDAGNAVEGAADAVEDSVEPEGTTTTGD